MPKRFAPILLAGAFGALVALLILVLRPNGAPFETSEGAAVSPARSVAPGAAVGAESDDYEPAPPSSDEPLEPSAEAAAALAPQDPRLAGAFDTVLRVPSTPAGEERSTGDADQRDEGEGDSEDRPERPAQWCFLKTREDHDYLSDSSAVWNGSRSVWMGKENDSAAEGGYFSSDILWQGVDATAFRGLRIEVSARVKGRAYLQFFVRTATVTDSGIVLHDNQLPSVPTTNRYVNLFPPLGVDWTPFSIVADVPVEADVVYYGMTLMGGRAIWIDDVRIATVDRETPLTQERSIGGRFILPVDARAALGAPANLDFEVVTRENAGC